MEEGENENYQWHRGIFQVSKDGEISARLAEKRLYKASREGTSEVGIRQRLNEDLYVNFGGMSDDNQRAVIQAYVFPLLSWIWIGGLVLIGGTLVCLVPSKIKMQYARTEVVGIAKKHACLLNQQLTARRQPARRVATGAGWQGPHISAIPHTAAPVRGWPPRPCSPAACCPDGRREAVADVRRVGMRLRCQCGCGDSVATCSMLECGFSKPAKERIARMQAVGMSDAQIIDAFVRDYGPGIYLAPPSAFGWVVPYARWGSACW